MLYINIVNLQYKQLLFSLCSIFEHTLLDLSVNKENKTNPIQTIYLHKYYCDFFTLSFPHLIYKAVGTILGLGGGGGKKILRGFAAQIFFKSHFFFKRIQFCSLVYL